MALAITLATVLFPIAVCAQGAGRKMLAGYVPMAIQNFHLQSIGPLPATNQLSLAIGLPLRNRAALDELLRQLYDPQSTNFHQFLTSPEFTARFGPTRQEYQAIRRFMERNGLTVVGTFSNRLVMDVRGPAVNVEHAFGVTLRRYHHPTQPRDFFAPDTEPSVPTNVPVADLWGLSDFALPTPLSRPMDSTKLTPLNYNGSGPGGSYQGRDFRNAYAPGVSLVGSGQVAAVAEFDGYYPNDIATYEANCGYTNVPLTNILLSVSGTPGYSGQGANAIAEVSLDIELQIAMAPGLSKLMVYEGNNPYTVFNKIATDDTAKQISCSWSWGYGPTHNWQHGHGSYTLDAILSQMVAQGQSFFQASGDSDAYTGSQAFSSSQGPIPMDSIYVTSVGGTTLTMANRGASWVSETVWNWGNNTGSGGGVSSNYPIPSWQKNVSMANNNGSTVYRNVPDVALTADAVEVVYNNGSSGAFAGTSCAAPLWAGFTALVNQQAVAMGNTPVGFLNPALYSIAAGPNYSACFHDITTGNNIGNNTPGLYYAANNYDLATGLGTPNGTNLINALAPPTLPYLTSQPSSQTVTNGANVSFSVGAGGQTPLSYQWRFNGTNLPAGGNVSGTTSSTLTLSSVTSANAGGYSVVVANSYGAVTSSVATLTVIFPPTFTAQPTNQTVAAGGNATFSATVSGATPLVYRWQKNGTNVVNGGNISGATSSVLTLGSVTITNAGNYMLVATNVYGSATSSVATLTVMQPAVITVPPANQTIQCGGNATFSVTATGTTPLHYQWSLDSAPITGATNFSLTLTNVHIPNHLVAVVVTNPYGSATSSVTLTVQDTLAPIITLNGSNPLYLELGNAYLEPGATAYDACAGLVPVSISGTVNTNAVSTNTVTYTATDGNGNTNTVTRTVFVRDTTPPTILWSFTNLTLVAGTNCEAVMPDVTGTNYIRATDLSLPLTIAQSPTNGAILPLGTNVVLLTVLDAYGNTSYSTNHIAVRDETPPAIVLNGPNRMTNQLGAVFTDPGVTASDDCSGLASLTTNGLVNVNVVGTNRLTYIATDGSGNTSSVTRTVVVLDTTPPTILWSFTNLVLAADTNCSAVMPDVTGTNYLRATDLSEPLTITQSLTNGTVLAQGTNLVVLTVQDAYGNAAYSTNTVVVKDETPPVITLNGSNPLYLELGSAYVEPGATAYDTCAGVVPVSISGMVNTNAVSTNTVTYTATDGSGNTNTTKRIVIVQDTMSPTIVWSFTNLVLAANTNCSAVMPNVTGTNYIQATDLSKPLTIVQTPTNGTVLAEGTHTVLLTVLDAYGNVAYSTNTLVVKDETPPAITLNGSNPLYLELGKAYVEPGATAYDACAGTVPVSISGAVNTNAVSTNTVTYTATDGNGNTNVVTRTVLVQDTTPPTILWSFTNLTLVAGTNCEAVMPNVTGTNYFIQATDLSLPLTIAQSPTNGAILPLGTNVVLLTVLDAYGNTSYSTNSIVVQDKTPPVIWNQPQNQTNTVGMTANFSVAATACTPPTYQWFFKNAALTAQTNDTLTLSNIDSTEAGSYFVVATASGGSTTSSIVTLTVNLISPTITVASSKNPSGYKTSLTFAASLAPTNATGTIQFLTNGTAFDLEPVVAGTAVSTNLSSLPRGTNMIAAVYSGDANDSPATNTLAQIVTNHPPVAADAFYNRLADYPLNIAVADLATNWSDPDGDPVSLAGIGVSTNGVIVTNDAGTLVYSSTNNVDDEFTCTITDGWGGTNLQTVHIAIDLSNATPIIAVVPGAPSGGITLSLSGAPGYTYILEATTNLLPPANWLPTATNTLDTNGVWWFTDTDATNFPQRFYRLKLSP